MNINYSFIQKLIGLQGIKKVEKMGNSQVEITKTSRQIIPQSSETAVTLRRSPTVDLAHAFRGALEIILIAALDFLGILSSFILALALRLKVLPALSPLYSQAVAERMLDKIWWFIGIIVGILAYERLYTLRHSFWRELRHLVKGTTLAFLVIFTVVSVGRLYSDVSRMVLLLSYMLCLFLLPLFRYVGKITLARLGLWRRKVLILGTGETGKLLAKTLSGNRYLGYEVVGFLEDDPEKRYKTLMAAEGKRLRVLGAFDDAAEVMASLGVRHVVVAVPGMPSQELVRLVNNLQQEADSVLVIPDLFGIPVRSAELDYFFEEQLLGFRVRNNLANPVNMMLKRAFDLAVGSIALLISAPVMALIAIAIKLDSPGPVIFAHSRIGRGGKEFKCYKFRTMVVNAEAVLQELFKKDPALKEEWERDFKLKNDPRITRVGKFLRKTSLDELPQIFNVLKGEMSLVGPRPRPLYERNSSDPLGLFDVGLSVLPGITGLWQISGRSELDFQQRLKMDAWYARNWSLWLDISILVRTIPAILSKKGAY